MARFDFTDDAAAAWFSNPVEEPDVASPRDDVPAEPQPAPVTEPAPTADALAVSVEGLIIPPPQLEPAADEPPPPAVDTEPDWLDQEIVDTASSAHGIPAGPASLKLAEHQRFLRDVNAKILALEEQLKSSDAPVAMTLLSERRLLDDQRSWLEARLPELQRQALTETHYAIRGRVNSQWPPTAQARAEAVENVVAATHGLLAAIAALKDAHETQHDILAAALILDSHPGMASNVASHLMGLQSALKTELIWTREMVNAALPKDVVFRPVGDVPEVGVHFVAHRPRVW